jgi:hypothetical protein
VSAIGARPMGLKTDRCKAKATCSTGVSGAFRRTTVLSAPHVGERLHILSSGAHGERNKGEGGSGGVHRVMLRAKGERRQAKKSEGRRGGARTRRGKQAINGPGTHDLGTRRIGIERPGADTSTIQRFVCQSLSATSGTRLSPSAGPRQFATSPP